MVILLTSGSGFLGNPIIKALSREYTTIASGHRELDLTDESAARDFFRNHRIDMVMHGAIKPGLQNSSDIDEASPAKRKK